MVGVPGRSKGCQHCRRRKKGCDGNRPACSTCLKAGIECSYGRKQIFVLAKEEERPEGKGIRLNYTYTIRPDSATRPHDDEQSHALVRPQPRGQTTCSDPVLPHSLAKSAYIDKYFDLLWRHYLPGGEPFMGLATGEWLKLSLDLAPQSHSMQLTLLAMGLCTMGRQDNKPQLIKQGLGAYGRSMKMLTREFSDFASSGKGESDTLIATSGTIGLFEFLFGTMDENTVGLPQTWRLHVHGQYALYLARGPRQFRTGQSHRLFSDARMIYAFHAMKVRKRSPLSTPEWRTVPWEKTPKSPRNQIVDCLFDLAGLLEDFETMGACPESPLKETLRQDLVRASWVLDGALASWAGTNGINPDLLDIPDGKAGGGGGGGALPTPEAVTLTHLTMLYWAASTITFYVLRCACGPPAWAALPQRTDPRRYARLILRAMPLLFRPGVGDVAATLASFPLATAMETLVGSEGKDAEEDRTLLLRLFSDPRVAGTIGTFLTDLQTHAMKGREEALVAMRQLSLGR